MELPPLLRYQQYTHKSMQAYAYTYSCVVHVGCASKCCFRLWFFTTVYYVINNSIKRSTQISLSCVLTSLLSCYEAAEV